MPVPAAALPHPARAAPSRQDGECLDSRPLLVSSRAWFRPALL